MAIANTLARNVALLSNTASLTANNEPDVLCRGKVLQFRVEWQNQDNWCWASVLGGVIRAFENPNPAPTLCEVAGSVIGVKCCPTGAVGACDEMKKLEVVLGAHLDNAFPDNVDKSFALVNDR